MTLTLTATARLHHYLCLQRAVSAARAVERRAWNRLVATPTDRAASTAHDTAFAAYLRALNTLRAD